LKQAEIKAVMKRRSKWAAIGAKWKRRSKRRSKRAEIEAEIKAGKD
jgi:hypothetical protein